MFLEVWPKFIARDENPLNIPIVMFGTLPLFCSKKCWNLVLSEHYGHFPLYCRIITIGGFVGSYCRIWKVHFLAIIFTMSHCACGSWLVSNFKNSRALFLFQNCACESLTYRWNVFCPMINFHANHTECFS